MRYLALAAILPAYLVSPGLADVRQSIEMTSVGSPFELPPNEWPGVTSADGRRDAILVYSGDVATDTNRYRVLLADRRAHARETPRTVFTLETRDDATTAGLSELRWAGDHSLTALAAGEGGASHLIRIDLDTGRSSVESADREDIIDYAENKPGGLTALIRAADLPDTKPYLSAYAGRVIGAEEPYSLMGDRAAAFSRYGFGSHDSVVLREGGQDRVVPLPDGEWPMPGLGLSVSPSGRFVTIPVGMFRSKVPSSWLDPTVPVDWVFFYGMRIYDRRTGTLRWLIDAPTYWKTFLRPRWSDDEQAVLIGDRLLRQADGSPAPGAAIVATASGKILCALRGAFRTVGGNPGLKGLTLVDAGQPVKEVRVEASSRHWLFASVAPSGNAIRLKQDMNHPPILVSHTFATGDEKQLLDLNPGLATGDVHVKAFHWRLKDGGGATAGLYLPSSFVPGKRLPLIIQTHGWDASQYWPDGPSTAGFAAHSLVQAGFAVVQIGWLPHPVAPVAQTPATLDMIDGLIDALADAGIADPTRLGITAWSATGLAVRSALVFARHHFSAAILVDSRDAGYFNYLLMEPGRQALFDSEMGGMPFGAGLEAWRAHSPMFNMDRVTTPVRLVSLGPRILAQWEQWASMRRLGKPIDFIWLPTSNHWPTRPSERLEVQQGAVDWYRFWLISKTPSDAIEAAEFTRWSGLSPGTSPTTADAQHSVHAAPLSIQ